MSSLLGKNEGIYNPALRFAFTNITDRVFESKWNGQPITIQPGQTVELPHHLANKLTDELVDSIMIGAAKLNEIEFYKANPNTAPNMYRAASSLGVPQARKIWEDLIVRPLAVDEESPEIQIIRAQIKEELLADQSQEKSVADVPVPTGIEEFAEIKSGGFKPEKPVKKPLKLKQIKVQD